MPFSSENLFECEPCNGTGSQDLFGLEPCPSCAGAGVASFRHLTDQDQPRPLMRDEIINALLATDAVTLDEAASQVPGSGEVVKLIRTCKAVPHLHDEHWRTCAVELRDWPQYFGMPGDPINEILTG